MELRDFADAVLRSDELSDKLTVPDRLTDTRPAAARALSELPELPELPGRPPRLSWTSPRPSVPFPKTFERPESRGHALHFFANHELLALELMALVLLKFPKAPTAFRENLGRTMLEEQSHLRKYVQRMHHLGVEFGDLAVSGFFWRAMHQTPSPLCFVTQMALTFEQANLDFCLHYRDRFLQVHDTDSAQLLQEVYDDEVGHVMHGLQWFRRWRDEAVPSELSEWQAYQQILLPPLSAARAKGPILDTVGRKNAGLSEDFIRSLSVYNRSKGRRPRAFVFNPGMEDSFRKASDAAQRVEQRLIEDLDVLMMWLAQKDDLVVLSRSPRLEFLEHLRATHLDIPHWEVGSLTPVTVKRHDVCRIVPWGHTQAIHQASKNLLNVSTPAPPAGPSAKPFSRAVLAGFLKEHPDPLWGDPEDLLGHLVTSSTELPDVLEAIRKRGHHTAVIKAPYATSGRRRFKVTLTEPISAPVRGFVDKVAMQEGPVWVAPWLDRIRDFGVPFSVTPDGRAASMSRWILLTDGQGAYRGHGLGLLDGLDPEVCRTISQGPSWPARLTLAAEFAASQLHETGFEGPAGMDAFLYRTPQGEVRAHPLIEINPRYTMGHIATRLHHCVAPGVPCVWLHLFHRDLQRAGHSDFQPVVDLASMHPVTQNPFGKLTSGVVMTTDAQTAQTVTTIWVIGSSIWATRPVWRDWLPSMMVDPWIRNAD